MERGNFGNNQNKASVKTGEWSPVSLTVDGSSAPGSTVNGGVEWGPHLPSRNASRYEPATAPFIMRRRAWPTGEVNY